MSQTFGREAPTPHVEATHRPVATHLIIIESGGVSLARLLLSTREQVGEFDAGAEEVTGMIRGLRCRHGADEPQWDGALAGHSATERAAALVYELPVPATQPGPRGTP